MEKAKLDADRAGQPKPRVRFMTCLWGIAHVQEWIDLALPSILAPGNLPALARLMELEVILLTDTEGQPLIEGQPAFRRLKEVCPVRFLAIDDLITGVAYGVTLTLAYARGVRDSGELQTNTYFVFMNADFILADGSLATLARKICEGCGCIVAPSLRATAERVRPKLSNMVDRRQHRLAVPPRRLVALALADLHPTAVGKIVDQKLFHCKSFNQFYWRINRSTLLGRYHLVFMLCLKPERPLRPINSYCDYGFIPEMAPSAPMTALQDSDEFFMLELAGQDQEADLIRPGVAQPRKIARALAKWTTREHRHAATLDFLFHASDLPPFWTHIAKRADTFTRDVQARMPQPAVDHAYHHYWVSGMYHWLRAGMDRGNVRCPPELEGGGFEQSMTRYLKWIRRWRGRPPDVPIWHFDWHEYRPLSDWIAALGPLAAGSALFVCDRNSPVRSTLEADSRFKVLLFDFQRDNVFPEKGTYYQAILCHFSSSTLTRAHRIIAPLLARLSPGGQLLLVFGEMRRDQLASNCQPMLIQFCHKIAAKHLGSIEMARTAINLRSFKRGYWTVALGSIEMEISSLHGSAQRILGRIAYKAIDMIFGDLNKGRIVRLPLLVPVVAAAAVLTALCNFVGLDRLVTRIFSTRRAAIVRLRRRPEAADLAHAPPQRHQMKTKVA